MHQLLQHESLNEYASYIFDPEKVFSLYILENYVFNLNGMEVIMTKIFVLWMNESGFKKKSQFKP